jgi:hypothetical protein
VSSTREARAKKSNINAAGSNTQVQAGIEGSGNVIGNSNQSLLVTVNVLQPGQAQPECLNEAERELLSRYRQTDTLGRLTIHHVAALAANCKGH